jgi:hypothetical protein
MYMQVQDKTSFLIPEPHDVSNLKKLFTDGQSKRL